MIAPAKNDVPRLALNAHEAAAALSISERHLTGLVSKGAVPHVRLGNRIVFPVGPLEEFLRNECRSISPAPTAAPQEGLS